MVVYIDQYFPIKPFWQMTVEELVKHNNKCVKLDQKAKFKWKIRKTKKRHKTRNKRNRKTKKRRNKNTRKKFQKMINL